MAGRGGPAGGAGGGEAGGGAIMYGHRARDLVAEMRHADTLAPYNEEGVRSVIQETGALAREAEEVAGEASRSRDPRLLAPSAVFTESVARNRRCLLAYQCVPARAGCHAA